MALERERNARSAGLRTFPLVAMASCAFVLVGIETLGGDAGAESRVLYGLMTGIGFIGGGAILKQGNDVRGTATAAAIWATGAVGAAVGFQAFAVAIVVSLAVAATLFFMPAIKSQIESDAEE